ncbi:hypothetical protein HanIR_Chr17g0885191 [Helianthus annuus]|nr:hypothetical protein HanIR_Chr17g0885191 [Helianthus annuus]
MMIGSSRFGHGSRRQVNSSGSASVRGQTARFGLTRSNQVNSVKPSQPSQQTVKRVNRSVYVRVSTRCNSVRLGVFRFDSVNSVDPVNSADYFRRFDTKIRNIVERTLASQALETTSQSRI